MRANRRSSVRRAIRTIFLLSCVSASSHVVATTPPGLAHDVDQKLATEPPAKVVAELVASGAWGRLMARIASGDTHAISLVRKLSRGTDAGTSEDITISLAEALPKATGEVLLMLSPDRHDVVLSFDRVCSAPFIEDTARHQRLYKAAALKAVRATYRTDPDLILPGESCLAALKKIPG